MKTILIKKNKTIFFGAKINDNELLVWLSSMIQFLDVDSDIVNALQYSASMFKKTKKNQLDFMVEKIKSGYGFYKACVVCDIFPEYCLGFFKTGEENGVLKKSLQDLKCFLAWKIDQKNKTINSMVYPLISLCVFVFTVFVFGFFVLPEIINCIDDTVLSIYFKKILMFVYFVIFLITFKIIFLSILVFLSFFNTKAFQRVVFNMPFIKGYFMCKAMYFVVYYINVGLSNKASLNQSIKDCIELQKGFVKTYLIEINNSIQKGASLNEVVDKYGFFSKEFKQIVKIGEKTDVLKMFEYLEGFYKQKYNDATEKIVNILPTFFLLFTSFFIIMFVVVIFAPLYNAGFEL